jgi:hypothetical protein
MFRMKRNFSNNALLKFFSTFMVLLLAVSLLTGAFPVGTPSALADEGSGSDNGTLVGDNETIVSENLTPDSDNFSPELPDFLPQLSLDLTENFTLERPENLNPKLDSQLNQLVEAQNQQSFRVFSLDVSDNAAALPEEIQVVIECAPGQAEAVSQVATEFGTIEASCDNLIQITVPVSSLEALAEIQKVKR